MERREDIGPGYRVYIGRHGAALVVLLCGGDKRAQRADIEFADSAKKARPDERGEVRDLTLIL